LIAVLRATEIRLSELTGIRVDRDDPADLAGMKFREAQAERGTQRDPHHKYLGMLPAQTHERLLRGSEPIFGSRLVELSPGGSMAR